jgi:uncharacterized protein (DUF1778 family)
MIYEIRMEETVTKRLINVRVTLEEDEILTRHAAQTGRSRTDVIRELIRSLKRKL